MDASAESGRNAVRKRGGLTWGGATEPVSGDHILRREQGRRNNILPFLADHEHGKIDSHTPLLHTLLKVPTIHSTFHCSTVNPGSLFIQRSVLTCASLNT